MIAYRELRLLELEVIEALHGSGTKHLDVDALIRCNVDQFYGIEIDGSAVQIATLAMWLVDHQMNIEVQRLGDYYKRLPLTKRANIVEGDALLVDWQTVLPANQCSYVLGNPPFLGKKEQSSEQKTAFASVMGNIKGSGVLDFVAAWYVKAVRYIGDHPIRCAFVSTNSITQGEQVGVIWGWMLAQGIQIHFAHRTFRWSNDAKGVAAVHCVIIGFGRQDADDKLIFEYEDVAGEPEEIEAKHINGYLLDSPDIFLPNRPDSISDALPLSYGSFALDDGNYTLSNEEHEQLLGECPEAKPYLRLFIGGQELIRGETRWCLWLKDAVPADIRNFGPIRKRVEAVREWRLQSERKTTRELADTPTLFAEIRQPSTNYLAFPTVSSERRNYIPIAMLSADVIASNQIYVLPDATTYHLGVLTSFMHMAWVRTVCGRLESSYRYSAGIVYNNYPWPQEISDKQKQAIESAAQGVLDVRAKSAGATLADLYDPLTMPAELVKAHQALDRAVDAAYGYKGKPEDASRVAFLFDLYTKLAAPLDAAMNAGKKRKSKSKKEVIS